MWMNLIDNSMQSIENDIRHISYVHATQAVDADRKNAPLRLGACP